MATLAGWRDRYRQLAGVDASTLTGDELDVLADALFWLDQPEASATRRHDAYLSHIAAGAMEKAMLAAWRLFYDHFLVGEMAVASGWLERARRHGAEVDSVVAVGWLAVAEADAAMADGRHDTAHQHANHALDVARRAGDPDLAAMALQTKGRALVELRRVDEGVALLDEAMVAVVNGELTPLFTGWVYCNLLSACHDLADLRRAAEWCDAAMRWCDDLREGLLYPGLCRIHAVELACLRGDWPLAEVDARRACDELTAHDPRYAGEAFYLLGEICRLRGDLEGAQEAFTRAHELGRLPQPGLALVRLAQDRTTAAVKALRAALQQAPPGSLHRAELLSAQVEAELREADVAAARAAADELLEIGAASTSAFLTAVAASADGVVTMAEGDDAGALGRLRRAWLGFDELGLRYAAARTRVDIGIAARSAGDDDTAALELRSALAAFEALGAAPDSVRVRSLLDERAEEGVDPSIPLTGREVEVLRLVARGRTNRDVAAALYISEHTVARHLNNIFTKIDVGSRAGATAYAYEHGLA